MESIKEICWKAREKKRLTAQAIADESGVPFATVNNFFSSGAKNPFASTVGPICAVLGVSLDEYYGITPDTEDLSEHEQELLTQKVEHKDEVISMLRNDIRNRDRIIFALLFVLVLALLYGITLDLLNPDMGLFKF